MADSVLDDKMLQQLLDLGGETLLLKMIQLFLEHSPQRIDTIKKAHSENNNDEIYRATHALKSSAANLGANELRFLCNDIEQLARDEKMSEYAPKLPHLYEVFDQVVQALNQKKETLS